MEIHRSKTVPYTSDQMYGVVNDIQHYHEFLPWCRDASVSRQSESRLTATVFVAIGKIKQSFTTENTMQPGKKIRMQLVDGPFKNLHGIWKFEQIPQGQCRVSLDIEFEFKNKLLKLALGKTFNHIMESMVESFSRRAEQLYGKQGSS